MKLSRRQFILGTSGLIAAGFLGTISSINAKEFWLISACSDKKNNHFVAAFSLTGQLVSKIPLPDRGHDIIAHPHKPGHAIVFARRPGQYLIEVNFINGEIINNISPEQGFHFYGHGFIKNDTIITSENNFDQRKGAIVIRSLDTYQVIEKFDSGGIGPHEISQLPHSDTLVIANGGILTHPSQPRKKLNLSTMAPNLSYMELSSGKIIETYSLDNHHLSIRHLDVSDKGKVIAGLQYQGEKSDLVPLVISHQGEEQLNYLSADKNIWRKMNHYTASVCIDNQKKVAAISCPRADLITYWSLKNNQFLYHERLADGAGLTFIDNFIASNGKGQVVKTGNSALPTTFTDLKFDNHLAHLHINKDTDITI